MKYKKFSLTKVAGVLIACSFAGGSFAAPPKVHPTSFPNEATVIQITQEDASIVGVSVNAVQKGTGNKAQGTAKGLISINQDGDYNKLKIETGGTNTVNGQNITYSQTGNHANDRIKLHGTTSGNSVTWTSKSKSSAAIDDANRSYVDVDGSGNTVTVNMDASTGDAYAGKFTLDVKGSGGTYSHTAVGKLNTVTLKSEGGLSSNVNKITSSITGDSNIVKVTQGTAANPTAGSEVISTITGNTNDVDITVKDGFSSKVQVILANSANEVDILAKGGADAANKTLIEALANGAIGNKVNIEAQAGDVIKTTVTGDVSMQALNKTDGTTDVFLKNKATPTGQVAMGSFVDMKTKTTNNMVKIGNLTGSVNYSANWDQQTLTSDVVGASLAAHGAVTVKQLGSNNRALIDTKSSGTVDVTQSSNDSAYIVVSGARSVELTQTGGNNSAEIWSQGANAHKQTVTMAGNGRLYMDADGWTTSSTVSVAANQGMYTASTGTTTISQTGGAIVTTTSTLTGVGSLNFSTWNRGTTPVAPF